MLCPRSRTYHGALRTCRLACGRSLLRCYSSRNRMACSTRSCGALDRNHHGALCPVDFIGAALTALFGHRCMSKLVFMLLGSHGPSISSDHHHSIISSATACFAIALVAQSVALVRIGRIAFVSMSQARDHSIRSHLHSLMQL